MGADITVIDAQTRVGGRVLTMRNGFGDAQHAEAGGDLIDESQHEIRRVAKQLGLRLTRILPGGFGYARADAQGRIRAVGRRAALGWDRLSERLSGALEPYRLAEQRWDSPIAADLARLSVADWLDAIRADDELRQTATGLRGFFLADPEELSLIALVDQFSEANPPPGALYRIDGGNDRLAAALAAPLGDRLHLGTELVAVSHRGRGVRASIKHRRQVAQIQTDYLVFALPASLLRRIPITPTLPPQQHDAIARLKYGRATKTLLQFRQRFWRATGRRRVFGSALPFGSVWDGNEEQRGRAGILALLAGGSASDGTREILARRGVAGLVRSLEWLGSRGMDLLAWQQVVWEDDLWVRGGYAFFDPGFAPSLRAWLPRPFGPLFFAGEHTSIRWQGYMNGAIESGRRAAMELAATHRASSPRSV